MTRSAITHMRQTGPRDTAARMGVVCPAAWGIGDVGVVGIRRYRRDASGPRASGQPASGWVAVGFADRTVSTSHDAMRRRREH